MGFFGKTERESMPGVTRDEKGWRAGGSLLRVNFLKAGENDYRRQPLSPSSLIGMISNPDLIRCRARTMPSEETLEGIVTHRLIAKFYRVPGVEEVEKEWEEVLSEMVVKRKLRGRAKTDFVEEHKLEGEGREKVMSMLANYKGALGRISRGFSHLGLSKEERFLAEIEVSGGVKTINRLDGMRASGRSVLVAGVQDQRRSNDQGRTKLIDLKRSSGRGSTALQLMLEGVCSGLSEFPELLEIELSSGKIVSHQSSCPEETMGALEQILGWADVVRGAYRPPRMKGARSQSKLGMIPMSQILDQADPVIISSQSGKEYTPRQAIEQTQSAFKRFLGTMKRIEI